LILLAIKDYIRQHQAVSRQALINHFDLQPDALDGLLAPLIAQGHVIETQSQPHSAGVTCHTGQCATNCKLPAPKLILWCEKPLRPLPIPIQIN